MPLGTKSSDKLIKFEFLIVFLNAKLNLEEKRMNALKVCNGR